MHHINRVSIDGFWETHEVDFKLFPEVTFLIGQNGSGKTTVINLVAAALTADFRTLDKIPFKKISIYLDAPGRGGEPRVLVSKTRKRDQPFTSINYSIWTGGKNSKEYKMSLDEMQEQLLMRRYGGSPKYLRDYYKSMSSGVLSVLSDIVNINWISVHRTPLIDKTRDDISYESTVDQRLSEISTELGRFFTSLSAKKDIEVREFQEYFFVSLLEEDEVQTELFTLEKLDNYEKVLINIFEELHVSKANTDRVINSFIARGQVVHARSKNDLKDTATDDFMKDLLYLYGFRRISLIIKKWNELQKKISNIFLPRDNYIKICNQLFQRKNIDLNSSNEIFFTSRTDKILTPQMLSSGEKQLLILLSETLLQKEQKSIFIADEPELSLHVLWQEKLIGSLRALNPHAQIIAATHSPDIVGPLSDRVIDMESVIP